MSVSVVIETYNLGERPSAGLARLLAVLSAQVADADAEVVVTHSGITVNARAEHEATLGRAIRWRELSRDADYYVHKNRGFDASTGEVIAFVDGDCDPEPTWLHALISPITTGHARVVAGATAYAGVLAPLATRLDFPVFDAANNHVRNFFANNVAFARSVFAAHRYPTIRPMFHGQCQVLCLELLEAGIAIRFAANARVIHAWPETAIEWLQVRLLRGADTVSLLPFVFATYLPQASPVVTRLGVFPALAILGIRALTGSWHAVRRGPIVRGLALVACVTLVDSIGAAAAPAVYRRFGVV